LITLFDYIILLVVLINDAQFKNYTGICG
jgi:hypothetical protein